jgi:hypothetical protein
MGDILVAQGIVLGKQTSKIFRAVDDHAMRSNPLFQYV